MAQECEDLPTETAVAEVSPRGLVCQPQHMTVLSERTLQLWDPPAETAVALVMPETVTGLVLWVVVPSPSCP